MDEISREMSFKLDFLYSESVIRNRIISASVRDQDFSIFDMFFQLRKFQMIIHKIVNFLSKMIVDISQHLHICLVTYKS